MKKVMLSLLALATGLALNAQTQVTLRVDMANQTVDPAGPRVAGNLQAAAGIGTDWTPAGPGNQLTDPDGDKIYEIVLTLPAGNYEYKFLNGDAWGKDESVPGACATNGNRGLTVGAMPVTQSFCYGACDATCPTSVDVPVTFKVNMNGLTVNAPGMILAGGFGSAGYPNWNGGADGIVMTDADADGIWETTLTLKTGAWQYKFLNGLNGWESVPCDCSASGNREVVATSNPAPVVLDPVFYRECDNVFNGNTAAPVTFRVDMSAEALGPGGLFVAGSFQNPAWQKNVIQLTDGNGDDIYEVVFDVLPGEHEYKYFNGTNGDPGSDTYAESGYDFRQNGCGCPTAGFNNRLLNVNSSAPLSLPIFVYNSCDFTSSTKDLSTATNIRLFPNPTSRNAYLEFEGAGEHSAFIADQTGRLVRSYAAINGNQLRIEKGALTPGLYFVTLRNDKGESATLKLSIQ
jgi:hypothetical protein